MISQRKRAENIAQKVITAAIVNSDFPDHPDDVVISKGDHLLGGPEITELEVFSYYTDGVVKEMLKELKGRDLFIAVKAKGSLGPRGKPIYIRHPYDKKTEYIRISSDKDFETYHSGRTVEYHVTMPAMCPYYVVDFDAVESWDKTKNITAEIADMLDKLPEVKKVEIRYTGKRGFHVLGWLKKAIPIDKAREDLKEHLREAFEDHEDLILGESPKGSKGALGVSPMKLNGGQVALYSLRVTGLCCVEIPRAKLAGFHREEARMDKVYKKLTGKSMTLVKNKEAADRVINSFLIKTSEMITAGYDREKIKPGYKGKFVIHDHFAKRAGEHFDLRIEMPVTSLAKALGTYGGKRPTGKEEPHDEYSDKPGTVYRSFAVRKHKLPTSETKIFIVETEDHPIEYGTFKGEISEGYGKGRVEIYDKGSYEILDVEGDKKYVLNFHGKKLNGAYALVKYMNGYLWVKTKEKKASAIDYIRPTMCEQLWDLSQDPPKLLTKIREATLNKLLDTCKNAGFTRPFKWITGVYLSGSSTGYNYQEDGDFDVDILYDKNKVQKECSEFDKLSDEEIFDYLKKIIYKANDFNVAGTSHPYSFMVLPEGDKPVADAIYDILKDDWVTTPIKIPTDFDPDKVFIKQRAQAWQIASEVDILIGAIIRLTDDFKKLDQYVKHYGKFNTRRIILLAKLKDLCEKLDGFHSSINALTEEAKITNAPKYPAMPFGPNWDERQILFKYLARYGYHRPVHMLYERLKDDPILEIINRFIPD